MTLRPTLRRIARIAPVVACTVALAQIYPTNLPIDHAAIHYNSGPLEDPATKLAQQVEAGKVKLEFLPDGLGYLPSLLNALHINSDSQALVFSKTSLQAAKIGPRNPRAIYFTDDAAAGWVRGGDGMEVAALDPRQGVVFYTLKAENGQPRFTRSNQCLHCHQGPATAGVPGFFVGSVYPDSTGFPARLGAIITDHRTPFADRWGGWYVNAKRGQQRDRANSVASDPAEPLTLSLGPHQNRTTLVREFDASNYLSPYSDIVALMTFEHQTQMINLLTRLGWQSRLGAPHGEIAALVEDVATYMLFAEEAPLREPVEGVSSFTETFPMHGPRDHNGRSLRDFDLRTRLFRYPLSYMIYSAAFDALPDDVRGLLYHRLYEILTAKDPGPKFANLSASDRRAILEILRDTKANLPASWRTPEESPLPVHAAGPEARGGVIR